MIVAIPLVVAAAPSISDIEPASISKSASPQVLTVHGARFTSGLSVSVTDPAGDVHTLSGPAIGKLTPTSFQVTVTLEQAGDYSMVVTLTDRSVSNSFGFKVKSPVAAPPSRGR
jgi:hypothetical protein